MHPSVLRRADCLLFLIFLAAAACIAAAPLASPRGTGGQVRVSCQGRVYGVYPLDQDNKIEIAQEGHCNVVSVHGGKVRMESSDCRNQVCVDTGEISRPGEAIVCLPNRVVVEIIAAEDKEGGGRSGPEEDTIDAVVK